jgi:hypothetical protein
MTVAVAVVVPLAILGWLAWTFLRRRHPVREPAPRSGPGGGPPPGE